MTTSFREQLLSVPPSDREAWVNARLGFAELPDDGADRPAEAAMCLPSAVEEVVAMVQELPLRASHTFVDVGSGAGRVVILAHLLTGARASGIEVQSHLVQFARDRAAALQLRDVTFAHENAADVDLDGDVFFLYAPAYGALLARIIKRLEQAARARSIAVCTVAVDLRCEKWLTPRRTSCETLTIYESG